LAIWPYNKHIDSKKAVYIFLTHTQKDSKMNSPNNLVIDQIPNDYIVQVHQMLDLMREQYGVRVRIKKNGRTSSPLLDLPVFSIEMYEETV